MVVVRDGDLGDAVENVVRGHRRRLAGVAGRVEDAARHGHHVAVRVRVGRLVHTGVLLGLHDTLEAVGGQHRRGRLKRP